MGVERKGRRIFGPNVGERKRILYGVPNKEWISNVLGVFSEIFLISRSAGRIFAGTVREGFISNEDRTLGVNPGTMLAAFGALR